MDNIVDQFIGLDPILGNQAKGELIKSGIKSLDLVISRFGSLTRTPSLEIRLSQLFGHFNDESVDKLLNVLKTGDWHKMKDACCCFMNLSQEPAASKLVNLLSDNNNIDIQRCSIDALGYLGAKDWSYFLLDIFAFDSTKLSPSNEGYKWEKLSYHVFIALLRIATKEEEGDHFQYRLPDIERFTRIAGKVKFKQLLHGNMYDVLTIFSHFKPVAADIVIQDWLKNENQFLQQLAIIALGSMRLNRIGTILRNYVELHIEDDNIKREVAEALANVPNKNAVETVKYIFSITKETSSQYKSICLHLAVSLDRIEDKKFVEQIYPHLILLGGEIAAHTFYNLGLLGYDERIWSDAIESEEYIIRASVAPVYAHVKGSEAISKLLQMERESSRDIEQLLILSALITAGKLEKKNDLRKKLSSMQRTIHFRMFRYTWKREIILALRVAEDYEALAVWENLFGINSQVALEELLALGVKGINKVNIQSEKEILKKNKKNPVNIFISYSHKDEKLKDELTDHLSGLKNNKIIAEWTDRKILPGEKWDEQIKQNLEKSKIILFLVSASFMSSGYINDIEIKRSIEKHEKGEVIIIPIITRFCDFASLPLHKFQALPKNAKPIEAWKPRTKAWFDVIDQLKKIITSIQ